MRVLLSTGNIGLGSGASWSFIRLCRQLKEKEIDVVALVSAGGGIYNELCSSGINTYIIKQSNYTWQKPLNHVNVKFYIHYLIGKAINIMAELRISRLIDREKIDIVHVNALTIYCAGKVAIRKKIPCVWHIREFMEEDLGATFINRKKTVSLVNKSSRIICISKSIEDKFKNIFDSRNFVQIYNGIPIKQFYYKHDIFNDDRIHIAMSGRIVAQKGQMILIKAVKILQAYGFNNIEVNIYGPVNSPDYLKRIEEFIAVHDLGDIINLHGHVKDVSEELQKNDILCMCSYKEGFGLSTVEGMLAGCLVIGYASGATEELIEDKTTGLLFRNRNAESLAETIKWAIENRDLAKNIARTGQEFAVENFSVERNADSIISVYRELIKE